MTEPTSHPQDDQQVPAAAAESQPPREERPEAPVTEESVPDAAGQADAAPAANEGADAPAVAPAAQAPADDGASAEHVADGTSAATDEAAAPAEADAPSAEQPTDDAAPSAEQPTQDAAPGAEQPTGDAAPAPSEQAADSAPAEQPAADVVPAEDAPVPAEQPAEAAALAADATPAPTEHTEPAPVADAVEAATPEAEVPAPADATPAEPPAADAAPVAEAEAAPEPPAAAAGPASPSTRPAPVPRPAPRPPLPGRRAAAAPVVPVPPVDAHDAAEAAAWGRVDPDGTVWVREATGERTVGQYPGADTEEALAFYVRRFLDLQAQVALFEARLPQLAVKEIDQTITTLRDALEAPTAVGDIDGLRARLEGLRGRASERRKELAAEREALKAQALAERTAIVERAEAIAATDPAKIQWRSTGEELRGLLDQWKAAQRSGPRLDRPSEDSLWKRFSQARTTFDRHRRQYFAELDATQGEAKAAKEKLVQRAEALSTSTDWGATSAAYRGLMDEWKQAGRANRKDDDALWARFRAAQQVFFDARNAQNAQVDAEYSKNLEVKLALLEQAEALLPVTNPTAAKAALRPIQDRWEEAGKVPRADVQRVEGRMRAVEQAVRDADDQRWQQTDPEKKARAEGAAAQLQDSITALEKDVADAQARGDERAVARAREALDARQAWLDQVLRSAE
ncbi:DUF349 domain-containing protein [Georgenia sp. MJ206]|uniref:DUF349 domain-containing protein n=1 Tax=Georgenia wangjunii TaxID=3117730 RepID=UPI002F261C36